jgi:hypothetical protein
MIIVIMETSWSGCKLFALGKRLLRRRDLECWALSAHFGLHRPQFVLHSQCLLRHQVLHLEIEFRLGLALSWCSYIQIIAIVSRALQLYKMILATMNTKHQSIRSSIHHPSVVSLGSADFDICDVITRLNIEGPLPRRLQRLRAW